MDYFDLEDAVLAALEPLKTEIGLRTLETYGGEFSPDSFGQFPINFPAVFVCIPSLTSEPANNDDKREAVIDIYAAASDLRGEKTARRGTIGAYAIARAVRRKLNRLIMVGAGRVVLRREELLGYSKTSGLCVIHAEYAIKFNQSIADERS